MVLLANSLGQRIRIMRISITFCFSFWTLSFDVNSKARRNILLVRGFFFKLIIKINNFGRIDLIFRFRREDLDWSQFLAINFN